MKMNLFEIVKGFAPNTNHLVKVTIGNVTMRFNPVTIIKNMAIFSHIYAVDVTTNYNHVFDVTIYNFTVLDEPSTRILMEKFMD